MGLRVVELAGIGPGPYACMMLADMGADVVQVRRPGDASAVAVDPMMRSRRCLELDLKNAAAVDVVLRLVDRADVLIEGYRPGVAERLGLGPEICCVRNPRLVYGRITGWGQDGPLAARAGHDINYLALSGLLHQLGPQGGKPVPPLNVIADYGGGGLLLAFGILCALQERQTSGRGQVIDAAMIDGAASFLATSLALRAQGVWRDAPGENFLSGAAHYYDTYETRDGRWVAIGAIEPQFHALLLSRLGLDPAEFSAGVGYTASSYQELVEKIWPELKARLAAAIARHTRDELQALFEGVDACVTPVLSLEEAMRHPHNVARNVFIDVDGSRHNAPAPRFSRTPPATPRATQYGVDATAAVLAEAGYGSAEIDEMLRDGVVA
jgi:alpha-methylacyl-CoA racemase